MGIGGISIWQILIILLVVVVLIYVLAVPYFGFTLSSGAFLIISILNLWNKGIEIGRAHV